MFNIPVIRRISHLRRYQTILNVFVRHGFGFTLDLLPVPRRWQRTFRKAPSEEPQTLPIHFREALEELGPTFVKLGQVLSTRPDLMPPEYITQLSLLQDTVPPISWEEIQRVLVAELNAAPEEVFRWINPEPLAAASLGQVHAALLHDGDEVVIKIQRPNILETIEIDLEILHTLAHYAQRHTPLGDFYNLEEIAEDFADTLHAELNYRREARNAERFRENFAFESALYIPRVYWDWTTQRVLTLERIRGIKIDNVRAIEAAGHDRHEIATHAAHLTVKEVLEDGFFHADPHPGNFVVMEDGSIGAMDFGMVGELSDEDRINLIRLYTVAIRMDAEGVVDEFIHIGAAPLDVDRRALARDVNRLLHRYAGMPLKDVSATQILNEIRPIVFRHKLQLPTNYWLLGKSLGMMEGIGLRLDPEFDIFTFSRPYVTRLLLKLLAPGRRQIENLVQRGMMWGDLIDEIPRAGMVLLDRLRKNEPVPLSLDRTTLNRIDDLFARLALSFIIAGMIVGLGLVIPATVNTGIWLRVVLVGGFVVALVLGTWVAVSILRR
ncbi:MAG: ABC1 kinase family protein [Anaerolineae bacterium]